VNGKTVCYDTTKGIWCVYDSSIPGYRSIGVAKTNLNASVAPTVNDDNTEGYAPGSLWIIPNDQFMWICLSSGTGAAVWQSIDNTWVLDNINDAAVQLLTTRDLFTDWILFGGIGINPITSSSLVQTINPGFAYIKGSRTAYPGETVTYPANSDTYEWLEQIGGPFLRVSVANGDAQPADPTPGGETSDLVQKVVTNGTGVTSATLLLPTLPNMFVGAGTQVAHAVNLAQLCPEPTVVSTTPYQTLVNQAFLISNLSADGEIDLPDGTQRCLVTVKLTAGGHTLTVKPNPTTSGQTINGNPTFTTTTDGTYQFISDGFGNFTSF
jgi:hypothetical protein